MLESKCVIVYHHRFSCEHCNVEMLVVWLKTIVYIEYFFKTLDLWFQSRFFICVISYYFSSHKKYNIKCHGCLVTTPPTLGL
jgi:hypothetical protein